MSSVAITASDVNKLRQMTGAGMMDCKKALTEANGDFEAAVDFLRKKGQKVAGNRADRDANEGVVIARVSADNSRAVLVVLNCETDFVAKNQDFIDFTTKISDIALNTKPADVDALLAASFDGLPISERINEQVGKIGEKMELHYSQLEAPFVVAYNHPGNRLATIVAFNKAGVAGIETVAKDVSMQAAAMAPVAVDKDDVDTHTLERELDIAREQIRAEGKPEEMVEKIAAGKLNKFYKDNTLLNQEFVKDNKMSVRQYIQTIDKDLTVTAFKRHALGN
ncbi:MAG TPA: translation elongation factor Ts [Flavobacteriales bacterium]|nr:translation elongation factor Ts [Flavobacteriales bacterium]HPH82575.1 translation elongation factor Ts [Flavobacteriales bacterium]